MTTIWVIDDSPLDVDRARQSLATTYTVETFQDGAEALERLSAGQAPDAMVLDQVMPGVSGLELLRFIRSEKLRTHEIPVLLLTAKGSPEQIVEGLGAGANDYLSKPWAPEELRARIDALLRSAKLLNRAVIAERTVKGLLESLPDALVVFDGAGRITFANAEAERVLVGLASPIMGAHVKQLLPMLAFPSKTGAVAPDLHIGARIYSPSLRVLERDGTSETSLILRDVTERRRADERRLDFYSIIAHDLRSPLSAMVLRAKRVMSGKLGPLDDKLKLEVEKLQGSMGSMANIINDFLDMARLERGGEQRLERTEIELGEVVESAADELRPIAESGGLALQVSKPEGGTPLVGDRTRLRQVVTNLVSNAIKFTPSGGTVTVKIEPSDERVLTSVADTGPGVPESSVSGLFERFHRAPGQTSTEGTGLGLMIVREIVEAHGGNVGVDTRLGHGSRFWFSLPR
ncbi:MAG: response regulator [Myxococcaceae bacterium]|nr:response regulator [Myxococcaceae bacterium]